MVRCLVVLPSDAFVRITHLFTGQAVPTGAAVVYCVHPTIAQDVTQTADAAHDAFGGVIVPWLSVDVTMVSTLAKEGPDETGQAALISSPTFTGTVGGESAPPQTAALVTKNTGLGGRRGRGRMYLPGLADLSVLDGGIMNAGFLGNLQAAVVAWQAALNTSNLDLMVEHGPETEWVLVNGQPRRVPVAGAIPDPTEVVSLEVDGRVATQRRRVRR